MGNHALDVPGRAPLRLVQIPTLGPRIRRPVLGAPGFYMRIDDDVRKTVVFFGVPDDSPGKGGISCFGTAFLLEYDGVGYLVTARHLTDELEDSPFVVRVNTSNGTSQNLYVDPCETGQLWHYHEDETVDIAVMENPAIGSRHAHDQLYLTDKLIVGLDTIQSHHVGIGDLIYVVGLFRFLHGTRRNLPIVHSGNIALLLEDEKIPVRDWRERSDIKTFEIDAYIVEAHGIQGLSGSPVFVRPSMGIRDMPLDDGPMRARVAQLDLALLGVWQGSWDAPPDLSLRSVGTFGPVGRARGIDFVAFFAPEMRFRRPNL